MDRGERNMCGSGQVDSKNLTRYIPCVYTSTSICFGPITYIMVSHLTIIFRGRKKKQRSYGLPKGVGMTHVRCRLTHES